jgi:hypothetical protein
LGSFLKNSGRAEITSEGTLTRSSLQDRNTYQSLKLLEFVVKLLERGFYGLGLLFELLLD